MIICFLDDPKVFIAEQFYSIISLLRPPRCTSQPSTPQSPVSPFLSCSPINIESLLPRKKLVIKFAYYRIITLLQLNYERFLISFSLISKSRKKKQQPLAVIIVGQHNSLLRRHNSLLFHPQDFNQAESSSSRLKLNSKIFEFD